MLERKFDVDRALKFTMRNGNFALVSNPFKIFIRDWSIWLMSWVPSIRQSMERPQGNLMAYQYAGGMPFLPDAGGGTSFPQVYCKQIGGVPTETRYTDDFIFAREKKGLFQIVQLVDSMTTLDGQDARQYKVPDAAAPFVVDGEMTTIIDDSNTSLTTDLIGYGGLRSVVRIATGSEFLSSPLAKGRERVESYDEHRIGKTCPKRFVIVRADFTTYAQCSDWDEAVRVMEGMVNIITSH